MNEDTVIRYMPLRAGTRPWRWHADANLIVLCESLDTEGREAALSDLYAHWRREGIRVVSDDEANVVIDPPPCACTLSTVPLKRLPTSLLTADRR